MVQKESSKDQVSVLLGTVPFDTLLWEIERSIEKFYE